MNSKVIAFIPVRGGSKSIPKKNSKLLAGKPLICYVVDAALVTRSITDIVISTDCDLIKGVIKQYYPKEDKIVVFERSAETATDTASTESAILDYLERVPQNPSDTFLLIQATSPLITSKDLDNAITQFKTTNLGGLLSVVEQKRFIWDSDHPINYNPLHRPRRQDFEGFLVENGAFYISAISSIIENKCRISPPYGTYTMDENSYFEIDEPSDWEILEGKILANKQKEKSNLLPHNIQALVLDFDGVFTDNKVIVFEDGKEAVICDRGDGMGLEQLKKTGLSIWVLSKEKNPVLLARCNKLGIPCEYGIENKWLLLQKQLKEKSISPENVIYVGNDINDIECMSHVGCAIAVGDAHIQAKKHANIILDNNGGNGAIRELCDIIMNR